VTLHPDLLAVAHYDDRGVPVLGRDAEFAALARAGARDLCGARMYEGHLNALGLVARFGTTAQRAAARLDARGGRSFGVWNTEDEDGVAFDIVDDRLRLRGWKSWASGARSIARPIVTARDADGRAQMLVVPLDAIAVAIDDTHWQPLGMEATESVRVGFDGVTLGLDARLGEPGDYVREPWFSGGAIRFVAVQTGALERLVSETLLYLIDRGHDSGPLQIARVAEMRVALETARLHVARGRDAWKAFDASADDARAADVVVAADCARVAVGRAATGILERAMMAVGARGLVAPHPFARLVRDLQMYLRQPAPDAIARRIGETAFAEARSARTIGSARSTATGT